MNPNNIKNIPPIRRNTPSEMREVIDAIEAGKPIQYKCVSDGETGIWQDTIEVAPNFHFNVYRVKPEAPKKLWRPFRDVQEFINAAGGLGAIWLKRKTGRYAMQVTSIEYADNSAEPICVDYTWLSLDNVFEGYTFADGRPCGVEEE